MNSININNPYMYNVALYIRLSKEDLKPNESESVSNQRSILRKFCDDNNLKVAYEYVDDGISGTTFNRPSFERMIKDIELKRINMIITKDLSRLGRDYIGIGHYIEKYFPENNVRYISVLDGIDTGVDSVSNDITPFKSILNDMYAKDISSKIKSVKHNKQDLGLFIGPKAPYGYVVNKNYPNKLFVDENVKHVVESIFKEVCLGKSCSDVASRLNKEGTLTPSKYATLHNFKVAKVSDFWTSARIREIVLDEVYIGNMVQGRMKKLSYKSKKNIRIPKDKWKIVENTHEAIISKDVFYKAQKMLDLRKKTRVKSYDYILKGMVYCYNCKGKMGLSTRCFNGKNTFYLRCLTHISNINKCESNTVNMKNIEEAISYVVKYIFNSSYNLDNMKQVIDMWYGNLLFKDNYIRKKEEYTKKINNIYSNIDKLYEDKLNGIIENEDFKRIYINKLKEKENIEKSIVRLEERINFVREDRKELLDNIIKKFLDSLVLNRGIITEFIDKIEIENKNSIYIFFNFSIK